MLSIDLTGVSSEPNSLDTHLPPDSTFAPARQVDLKGRLLPEPKDSLVIPPITARIQSQIEMEEDLGHDEAHLVVCQLTTNAVPGAEAEGLMHIPPIVVEWRGGVCCCLG